MNNRDTMLLLEEIAEKLDNVVDLASKLDDCVFGRGIINDIEPVSCAIVNELKAIDFGWQVV